MTYHLQHEEHLATMQAAVTSCIGDTLLISSDGEQVIASKLLLAVYSPMLRGLLLTENNSAISLPLSTDAIMALLDLLARGRTFSSTDVHLLEVVKAGTMLGLSLGKLQLGSRREKGNGGTNRRSNLNYVKLDADTEMENVSFKEETPCSNKFGNMKQGPQTDNQAGSGAGLKAPQFKLPVPNFGEDRASEQLSKSVSTPKPLNPCRRCDLDFIYPSLLNHHLRSVHDEKLSDKRGNLLQCDSCQFSTPKLAFLKTHNKFMHP